MNILKRIVYAISFNRVPGQVMTKRSIDMQFVWIPAGEFVMGSSPKEKGHCSNEGPQRKVTISKGFWLGQTPVTQRQYVRIMGNNPSLFNKDHDEFTRLPQHQPFFDERPVEQVSWNDAIGFCQTLSRKMYEEYSLPTEAQWEYACRAGTTTAYCFGDNISQLEKYAWYLDNSNGTTKIRWLHRSIEPIRAGYWRWLPWFPDAQPGSGVPSVVCWIGPGCPVPVGPLDPDPLQATSGR
jgi:formylglycine-generating enzyme required for sulfatase activity